MKKTKSIPAAEWARTKTDEDRQVLIEKYTTPMTDVEIAAHLADEAARERLAKRAEKELAAASVKNALPETDAQMARVAEDVLHALIAKGLLAESDLPQPVLDKLAERATLRKALK